MGDGTPDLFDQLPEDVTQMIFGAICDCKSLVRCMAVCHAFYRHAVHVSSLSIVCPDNYSMYEEKLNRIYSMVKEFRELQTLVVRVGRPRDDPASWTRCMRYAEIGASVEKFMFMAAKSGDFSELDNAFFCSEYSSDCENSSFRDSAVQDGTERAGKDQVERVSLSGPGNSHRTWDIDSQGPIQNRSTREFQYSAANPGLMWSFFLQSLLRVRGFSRIQQLSDFSLRQVIAPSNDVMRRMLPVIHFAILQGLNEFRDVIPSFIANFPKLKRFLLVDMSESVTIHLRPHHLEEIRLSNLQDIAEYNKYEEEHTVSENITSHEMLDLDTSIGRNHEIAGIQSANSKNAENDLISSVYDTQQSKSDQKEDVFKWTADSTSRNKLECESNSSNFHSIGMQKMSEELDLGEKSSCKIKLEKLKKGKGLLEDPQVTENGSCRKKLVHNKSESRKIGDRAEIIEASYGSHLEKDDIPCTNSEDANLRYSHKESERLFHLHQDRFRDFTYKKAAFPSCQFRVSPQDAGETPCNSSFGVLDDAYVPINNSSGNICCNFCKEPENAECLHRLTPCGKFNFCKEPENAECLHRLTPCGKLMEKRCSKNAEGRNGQPSCSMEEDNQLTCEIGGHALHFEQNEGWNSQRDNCQKQKSGNCCTKIVQAENIESRQESCRYRNSRFQDIYSEGRVNVASRHLFKRGSKNESIRFRDSGRNCKTSISRTVDDSFGNLESARRTEDILGESRESYARKRQQFQTEDEFQYSPHISIPNSTESSIYYPVNSGLAQKQHCSRFSEWDQSPVDSSFQMNSLARDSSEIAADKLFSGKDNFENSDFDTLQYEKNFKSGLNNNMNAEVCFLEGRTCLEGNGKESSSNFIRVTDSIQASQGTSTDRLVEREVSKEIGKEWVRRSMDARRNSCTIGDDKRDWEAQRIVRNTFQRRKNDLEREALSFDYSFWRAEQVVAENYHLSDVSMCIATYSAKPLGEADIEFLSYAALAGPLLAATVAHVNKQRSSHNL